MNNNQTNKTTPSQTNRGGEMRSFLEDLPAGRLLARGDYLFWLIQAHKAHYAENGALGRVPLDKKLDDLKRLGTGQLFRQMRNCCFKGKKCFLK